MENSPFTTVGDEPVEARIVAWVLGEASAFEAAELERLCDERPELLVFRRRMRALHGLLTEAESAQPDEGWKLPPEKRKALDDIFGGEKVLRMDAEKEKRIRRSGRRAFLAIAACLVLTAVVMGLLGPAGIRKAEQAITGVSRSNAPAAAAGSADQQRELETLRRAVQNQEDKLEERRKVLGTIARSKGLAQREDDSLADQARVDEDQAGRAAKAMKEQTRENAITRGLDAQDFVDAKRDFDAEQQRLDVLKLELADSEAAFAEGNERLAANQPRSQSFGRELTKTKPATRRAATPPPPSPAAPASATAETLAATSSPAAAVPVPEGSVEEQMSVAGDADDFGDGWGNAKRPADGRMAGRYALTAPEEPAAKPAPVTATAAPVGAKDLNSVDAIPQIATRSIEPPLELKPGEAGAIMDGGVALGGAVRDLSAVESKEKAADTSGGFGGGGGVPAAEDLPAVGALSDGSARSSGVGEKKAAAGEPAALEAGVEEAARLRKVGKYAEARDHLEKALAADPDNDGVKRELESLDDPIRSNPALTYEHGKNVDDVRRKLYMAEGNYNLGKYDEAKREYENTLRIDPYNAAARRGLERVEAAKSDYYRAAYDHTRSELLSQVDSAWELSVHVDQSNPAAGQGAGPGMVDRFSTYTGFRQSALGADPSAGDRQRRLGEEAAAARAFGLNGADSAPAAADFSYYWDVSKGGNVEGRKTEMSGSLDWGASNGYFFKSADLANRDQPAPPNVEFEGFANTGKPIAGGEPQGPAQAGLKVIREFEYPTEYEAPEKPAAGPAGVPVTPATPTSWMSQDEGTKGGASKLAQREVLRRQETVSASDKLLMEARDAYAKGEYDKAYDTYEAALRLLPDAPLFKDRIEFLRKSLGDASIARSTEAKRVGRYDEAQQWLEKASEWDPENASARQQLLADATSEIAASEDPYSTFSLNISDASFKVAQAALAKGERPDPAGIKVEQFYNAVDYGDPAPAAGEPVAVTIEQAAHPVVPGRNLVRVALKTAAAGRSATQPLRLTLLVDQSGSMVREDRRAAMDKALAGLTGLLTKDDLVTVIGFSRTPRLLADGMTGDQAGKLKDLVNQSASEGGTNLEEAIKLAEQLADRRKLAGAQNRIVLFTDGAANLGNADPARLAEKVKELRQKGIAFDIAGIAADGLNDELLGELARNGNGRYYVVGKGADETFAKQLAGAFRPAAENVKVQVRFNPERVGHYKLIGFEKDRLKTEDFRNDAVDAAELAAEEAGIAIYQVEVLPAGKGELGEVSVRFRDAAVGQMVERTWTVPHDGGAPAIDRATPSMQLAALAMLAAEKLKGGPLAEAIDFKQLADPQANVKRFYGTNGRAGEVLNMVDALK
jgi:tetratricopeptide (TPR) repeat protein